MLYRSQRLLRSGCRIRGTGSQNLNDFFRMLLVVRSLFPDRGQELVQHVEQEFFYLYISQAASGVVFLQLVQVLVFRQVLFKILITAEGIQVLEHGVAFQMTRVADLQVSRIGVHSHDLLFQHVLRIRQVDGISQRFTHLRLTVRARQSHAGLVRRQIDFRLDQHLAVHVIEAAHDFPAQLQHRLLVLAYRNGGGHESGDIRSLAHRIVEEAHRDVIPKTSHLNFGFDGRVPLHAGHGNQVHVIHGQLVELRHQGLNHNGSL